MRIIALGPQRRPTVADVAASLGLDGLAGPVAMVIAGWREREPDDGELSALLGGRSVNLELYQRWLDVQDRDQGFAAAERRLSEVLGELTDAYLLRLDHALQAVYELQRRPGWDEAVTEAIAAVRELDAAHLRHVSDARGEFYELVRPHERPVIAEHRAAVQAAIGGAAALVVTGGHVGVLADVLHLFNVAAALAAGGPDSLIAWSAGAMALTDRIVLFGDRAPHGPGHAEVYASGLSLIRDVVLLPHARSRLLLADKPRMSVFARRFEPARCVLLENGTRVDFAAAGGVVPGGTRVLGEDGYVAHAEAA